MDPLTHTCSGILIGQALRPRSAVRRQTMWVLALAASAMDLDSVSYLWGPGLYGQLHHTYSHTLLGLAILVALLAGIERIWVSGIPFIQLLALNALGCSVHLVEDLVAVWPLRLLWPWSGRDFVLRWTGDFDLVVLIVIGLATGLSATDGLRDRGAWVLGGATLVLLGYFIWFPGAAGIQ